MAETRIDISHIVVLVVYPTRKTQDNAVRRTRASVMSMLMMAKGQPILMKKLADLFPAWSSGASDDQVIAAVEFAIWMHLMVLELNILPPKTFSTKLGTLWKNYPSTMTYPTDPQASNSIWNLIGGKVLYNGTHEDPAHPGPMIFANSCATRMSQSFNKSGLTIPYIEKQTSSGADHSWYIYRVEAFIPQIVKTFGQSTVLDKKTWMEEIKGKSGIVHFVSDFRDATGHCALWNGTDFKNDDDAHDGRPEVLLKVEFWEVPW